jgi:two-component system NtrC family sensor kinase
MKLQTKFNLAIIATFCVVAVGMAALTVYEVNTLVIRLAENRVRIYMRAAWEILDGKTARTRAALEILAQDQAVLDALTRGAAADGLRPALEAVRRTQKMDILNLLSADGKVLLRTRPPYNRDDSVAADPLVRQVMTTRQASSGAIIMAQERLDLEGSELLERVLAVANEPRGMFSGAAVPVLADGKLVGILEMGSLLNGATEKVDAIRDAVFANEIYNGKPVGTATIFMDDLRISTNVLDRGGRRAVGTRASQEVAQRVLKEGLPWTGRAFVVDTWYLSQYDPIRSPDGAVIGMLYVGELEQQYLDLMRRTLVQNLSVILAGMALAFLAIYYLVRSIVRPIHTLSEATQRLAAGDLAHRVAIQRRDEIGDLAHCFNQMGERLQTQRDELERDKQQLQTLSEQLQVTNRNYIEMLGFVTHELKNPLTSAIMGLYTVKDGYLGELNAAQKKSLESVAKSLDYFQDMVRNYLDLSRLEQGQLVVKKRSFKLCETVIGPSLEALERQMQDRQITVDNRVPENLVVNADPTLLRVVYDDLLSNAVKYGRAGGGILLEAEERADKVVLSVRNDGEGIPPEKQAQLFKRFSRLDTPSAAGKKGTGLGLYICKEIVEKHGGEIWSESRMGEWVKFSFTLPHDVGRSAA